MDSNKLLTIVIPTYNRCEDVCKNVRFLDECITKYKLGEKIYVIVSDNHSDDGTYNALKELSRDLKNDISFRCQEKNIGGTFNSRSVLKDVITPYAMLLGDDDFLDEAYLDIVINYLENNKEISAIVPNFHSNLSNNCRDNIREDRFYAKGSQHLGLMFKAHQMSGLVFRVDGVLDTLFAKHGENRYYQVFCVGFNMMRGTAVHITRNPMCVNDTNKKFWSYGNDGLWDDMFLNIRLLDLKNKDRKRIERYYLKNYSWSCIPKFARHPVSSMKMVAGLHNMTNGTKWMVPFLMVYSGFKIVYTKKIRKVGRAV